MNIETVSIFNPPGTVQPEASNRPLSAGEERVPLQSLTEQNYAARTQCPKATEKRK